MDKKTVLVVQKILDLELALADLLEEVSLEAGLKPRTVDRIRSLKDRIGRIKDIIGDV